MIEKVCLASCHFEKCRKFCRQFHLEIVADRVRKCNTCESSFHIYLFAISESNEGTGGLLYCSNETIRRSKDWSDCTGCIRLCHVYS